MANRLKSKKSQAPAADKLRPEKDPQVTVKQIVKDERTHKITGAVFLLLAVFLFIAFTSYLFTWKEDQDKVFHGASILLPSSEVKVANLLGNLGALIAHQFFYKGFGLASYLFCSFFFIIGVNLLFTRKVFSINRNLRYVLTGLVFFSVAMAFVTRGNGFPWGGAVGDMISDWLVKFLGWLGTAALLLVAGLAYFIWRFNPVFKMPTLPVRDKSAGLVAVEEDEDEESSGIKVGPGPVGAKEGAKFFVDEGFSHMKGGGNVLKEEGGVVAIAPQEDPSNGHDIDFTIIERQDEEDMEEEPPFVPTTKGVGIPVTPVLPPVLPPVVEEIPPLPPVTATKGKSPAPDLELEIKSAPMLPEVDAASGEIPDGDSAGPLAAMPDYEPTLDLRDYKYPTLDLLEAHGSEKIVQDPAELEANKNQIINTLKNYDIAIQKISATVGPTVTLYEIVPAAGVRISRIKNLEDDIALSLAALGIRIIAPIPGKGTIGIEVPNVKKTVVSMRTLLASDKFQHSNFSLPIAIGKKIDNENFIVDLASMPHLLMAGATGQGKSVGLNAKMKEQTLPEIEKISHSANELLNKMNTIIWTMTSSNDSVENLVAYIRSYAVEFFENTAIDCYFSMPASIPHREISGEKRRNMFLSVKESLNNVLKHSQSSVVKINVLVGDKLTIEIQDDGVGINMEKLRKFGNGLNNMRKRMASIDGEFNIENSDGTRTVFGLML